MMKGRSEGFPLLESFLEKERDKIPIKEFLIEVSVLKEFWDWLGFWHEWTWSYPAVGEYYWGHEIDI